MNHRVQEMASLLKAELENLQKLYGNTHHELWEKVYQILDSLEQSLYSSPSDRKTRDDFDEYLPLPDGSSATIPDGPSTDYEKTLTLDISKNALLQGSQLKESMLSGDSFAKAENKTDTSAKAENKTDGLLEKAKAPAERVTRKLKPPSLLHPNTTSSSVQNPGTFLKKTRMVLQQADPELQNELKHDRELQELVSATQSSNTIEHAIIQENGGCFLLDTQNGNYNAMHLTPILADCWNMPNASELVKKLAVLLPNRNALLEHTTQLAHQSLLQSSLKFWMPSEFLSQPWVEVLRKEDFLAKYYADLTIFRLAIVVRTGTPLPEDLISLAPQGIFDLANAVKWPPSEPDKNKKELLKEYTIQEKSIYLLQELAKKNPIEFDLKKQDFLKKIREKPHHANE